MITASFIDPQGQAMTDAVVYLRRADYSKRDNKSWNESFQLDTNDFTTPIENSSDSVDYRERVNCSFYYWPNAQAKIDGLPPYIMANAALNNMDFGFEVDNTFDGLTLEQKCEKHFNDVILPTLV